LGITAHYITAEWEMKSCVLQTPEVVQRHTAANVAKELQDIVQEWAIE